MALTTKVDEGKRPAILRLHFEASTGYILPDEKSLYHSKTQCEKELKRLFTDAKQRGASWAEGSIVELYRDKDSGQYREGEGIPCMGMSFGRKP